MHLPIDDNHLCFLRNYIKIPLNEKINFIDLLLISNCFMNCANKNLIKIILETDNYQRIGNQVPIFI